MVAVNRKCGFFFQNFPEICILKWKSCSPFLNYRQIKLKLRVFQEVAFVVLLR